MGAYIHFNGEIIKEDQPIYTSASRAARFGDGIFETMRARNGKILFEELHAHRLFKGLALMRFDLSPQFKWPQLRDSIVSLLEENGNASHARVRLMITRGDGAIMQSPVNAPQVLIESWETNDYSFNDHGMKVNVFADFPRSRNAFSNIKTCNFLPSVMAAIHARGNNLDECLLVNEQGRICDATISNIFWIKGGQPFTAPLIEGGIAGVMRSHLMQILAQNNLSVTESVALANDLSEADEIFLTNVMRGVHWVSEFGKKNYSNSITRHIFQLLVASISA